MYDDGTHGYNTKNDNIFTIKYLVSGTTPLTSYFIDLTAKDAANNKAEAENTVIISVTS